MKVTHFNLLLLTQNIQKFLNKARVYKITTTYQVNVWITKNLPLKLGKAPSHYRACYLKTTKIIISAGLQNRLK